MAKNRAGMTRREFLRNTGLATGAVALAGLAPTTTLSPRRANRRSAPSSWATGGSGAGSGSAKWPKKFGEAPALAELVKAGKLPPVEQRISEEPMVVKPLHSVGKYGGTWRRAFTGPADAENGNRICSTDKILFWDYTATKVMPCVARDWKVSDDGKVVIIFLRKGMKWSDGQPFTAVLTNPELGDLFIGAQQAQQGDRLSTEFQGEYRLKNGFGVGGGVVNRTQSIQSAKFTKLSYQNQWQDIKFIVSTQWQNYAGKDYGGGYVAVYNPGCWCLR